MDSIGGVLNSIGKMPKTHLKNTFVNGFNGNCIGFNGNDNGVYSLLLVTKTVISSTAIFVVIDNNTLYGSKSYIFLVCQKSLDIKIMFNGVNISKRNYWLLICIAKSLIWTTLKVIFSIFRCFCSLRFQIFKYCPNHTSMEISFIQLSDDA